MTTYATDHAGALADLQDAGAAVTFTHASPGTHDPTTGTYTVPATTTVSGYAVQTAGDPEQYRALSLVESEAPTLLFVPSTYGALPALNDTVSWNSLTWAARAIRPVAPDGTAIIAKIVVSR